MVNRPSPALAVRGLALASLASLLLTACSDGGDPSPSPTNTTPGATASPAPEPSQAQPGLEARELQPFATIPFEADGENDPFAVYMAGGELWIEVSSSTLLRAQPSQEPLDCDTATCMSITNLVDEPFIFAAGKYFNATRKYSPNAVTWFDASTSGRTEQILDPSTGSPQRELTGVSTLFTFGDRVMVFHGGSYELRSFDPSSVAVGKAATVYDKLDLSRAGFDRPRWVAGDSVLWAYGTRNGTAVPIDVAANSFGKAIELAVDGSPLELARTAAYGDSLVAIAEGPAWEAGGAVTLVTVSKDGVLSELPGLPAGYSVSDLAVVGDSAVILWDQRQGDDANGPRRHLVTVVDLATGTVGDTIDLRSATERRYTISRVTDTQVIFAGKDDDGAELVWLDPAGGAVTDRATLPSAAADYDEVLWIADAPAVMLEDVDDDVHHLVLLGAVNLNASFPATLTTGGAGDDDQQDTPDQDVSEQPTGDDSDDECAGQSLMECYG